ncbi:MAG TPA: M20/M25/M40 family metallo-hydrolase [Gemmatimonadaceae bacterium]|nr:M20/M25/M40 family metallo-hydrolase [Gemmatimonadaceae bacterium]
MKRAFFRAVAITSLTASAVIAQEKIDLEAINRIRDEGFNRSQVMETSSWLTDVYGPRLTGSPTAKQAGDWAIRTMQSWGISNPRYESWGPFGRGWIVDRFHMQVLSPVAWPVIAYPGAWSAGTKGVATGEVVYIPYAGAADSMNLKGKVRGKWVMTAGPRSVTPRCTPDAVRMTEERLATMASAQAPQPGGGRGAAAPVVQYGAIPGLRAAAECRGEVFDSVAWVAQQTAQINQMLAGRGGRGGGGGRGAGGGRAGQGGPPPFNLGQFLLGEGALGHLTQGNGADGTVFPGGNGSRSVDAPAVVPSISLAAEHYGRIHRMIQKNVPVRLESELAVRFFPNDLNSFNIVGEIPGSDPRLKDEVVMLGAHFDSWHSGTGATDNVAGSAVMMEAMRILKTLNLPMKRTVRIGLWMGEEQGLIGSREYVRKHFGYVDSAGQHFTPEHGKITGYFNVDNGTGAIRGIYTQGNVEIAPIFRQWLAPFADLGATTVTFSNTGGTDHQAFDAVGIPGFQFIQDPMDYNSRTHHSNMDVFEKLVPSDMKRNSVIVAAFVYNAANRDQPLPRKPAPAGGGRGGE